MRILCVDDEDLVLQLTADMCRALRQQPEVAAFNRAGKALAWLEEHTADIALLDINMPDMDGLVLAARIKKLSPDTSVIFLTGYEQYALDALRLHASGYILKPVGMERLEEEVEYALSVHPPKRELAHIEARTFGEFDLFVDGRTVAFSRSKAKELLAYLIDRQGRGVTRADAFAALWEDEPYDRARQKYFDVVIRSLRQTLEENGVAEILEVRRGVMRICPDRLECDLYRFFAGDIDTIDSYRGEYMSSYAWANMTEGYLAHGSEEGALS